MSAKLTPTAAGADYVALIERAADGQLRLCAVNADDTGHAVERLHMADRLRRRIRLDSHGTNSQVNRAEARRKGVSGDSPVQDEGWHNKAFLRFRR